MINIIEEHYTITKNNDIKVGIPVYEDLVSSYVKVNGKDKIYHREKLINDDGYLNNSLEKNYEIKFRYERFGFKD